MYYFSLASLGYKSLAHLLSIALQGSHHGAYAQNIDGVGWSHLIFWDTIGGK